MFLNIFYLYMEVIGAKLSDVGQNLCFFSHLFSVGALPYGQDMYMYLLWVSYVGFSLCHELGHAWHRPCSVSAKYCGFLKVKFSIVKR